MERLYHEVRLQLEPVLREASTDAPMVPGEGGELKPAGAELEGFYFVVDEVVAEQTIEDGKVVETGRSLVGDRVRFGVTANHAQLLASAILDALERATTDESRIQVAHADELLHLPAQGGNRAQRRRSARVRG